MKDDKTARCVHCRERTRHPKVKECPSCAIVSAMRKAGVGFPYLVPARPR